MMSFFKFRAADPSPDATVPGKPMYPFGRTGIVWLALAMALVIVSLLVWNNRQYIFHDELHETGDWASNSLFVREGKHGLLLHGHYSRWNFYHPGPALLLTMALGEAVFFDWLRIVPTELNGQMFGLCVALTLFFSFALALFAQGLGRHRGGYTFFLPLALLFAIWHYSSVSGAGVFMETWPASPPILVFLCLLVASAATASGRGWSLPLLVVAGGWLVHNHVAQPLFVVPLTLLAYGGMIVSCRPFEQRPSTGWRRMTNVLFAGWRTFPTAHFAAALLLLLFILPLLLDALHGSSSNLGRILAHLHRQQEPSKKLLRSFCYFLTFGAYGPYVSGRNAFGKYSAAGMLAFVELHWRAYLGWITTLVATPVLFLISGRLARRAAAPGNADATPENARFIPWFYAVLSAAFILTLVWGTKQDGDMYYFNALFNYSIYYGAALGLAAGLAFFLYMITGAPGTALARTVICAALWCGVAAALADKAPYFKIYDSDSPSDREAARSVKQVAAATLPPGSICFLGSDPWDAWPVTIGVALQLERLGYTVRVDNNWDTMFGVHRTISDDPASIAKPIVRWQIVPVARDPAQLSKYPLQTGYGIEVRKTSDLNPADGQINFSSVGNFGEYAVFGWPPTGGDWTYSDEHNALLEFHPLPLPDSGNEDVELSIAVWSFTPPGKEEIQRMDVQFNGKPLGTFRLPIDQPAMQPVRIRIAAASWRDAAVQGDARLSFHFPDAKSPESVGMGADVRPLGGGFQSIEFHLVEKEGSGSEEK